MEMLCLFDKQTLMMTRLIVSIANLIFFLYFVVNDITQHKYKCISYKINDILSINYGPRERALTNK